MMVFLKSYGTFGPIFCLIFLFPKIRLVSIALGGKPFICLLMLGFLKGPFLVLLFSCYTLMILHPDVVSSNIVIYADDTTLCCKSDWEFDRNEASLRLFPCFIGTALEDVHLNWLN